MSESDVYYICVKRDSFFKVCKSSGLILKYFLGIAIWAGDISLKLCTSIGYVSLHAHPPDNPF